MISNLPQELNSIVSQFIGPSDECKKQYDDMIYHHIRQPTDEVKLFIHYIQRPLWINSIHPFKKVNKSLKFDIETHFSIINKQNIVEVREYDYEFYVDICSVEDRCIVFYEPETSQYRIVLQTNQLRLINVAFDIGISYQVEDNYEDGSETILIDGTHKRDLLYLLGYLF